MPKRPEEGVSSDSNSRKKKETIVRAVIKRVFICFAVLVAIETAALPSGSFATAQETPAQNASGHAATDLFPPELVRFRPLEGNPLFQGRGKGFWDERIRERGWILREEGIWHMWYTGYEEKEEGDDRAIRKLGYATSSDGLQWKRYQSNPIFDQSWVEDMSVVKRQGTYYMFSEGLHDVAQLLTSPDGIHWKLLGPLDIRQTNGEPISNGPRGTPTAWFEDDTWYLFYERFDRGIWLATSQDMQVWKNLSDTPVIELGPEDYDCRQIAMNQIIKYNDRYYAYYHGSGKNQPHWWSTNVATSKDLVHWTKYAGNPLLPLEDNKSSGILIHDGQQFRLYTMHGKVDVHLPQPLPAESEKQGHGNKNGPQNGQ